MSLILEALNRADKDRSKESTPPSLPPQAIKTDKAHNKKVIAISTSIIIGLIAALIYTTAIINQKNNSKSTPTSQPEQKQTLADPLPLTQTKLPTKKPSQAVSKLYQKSDLPPIDTPTTKKQPTKTTQVIHTPKNKQAAIEATHPFLSELPWNTQREIPTIDYNQHFYSTNNDSFVEINNKIIKAGDHIGNGLHLISIEKEFINLKYKTVTFRLPALNSWVNFN